MELLPPLPLIDIPDASDEPSAQVAKQAPGVFSTTEKHVFFGFESDGEGDEKDEDEEELRLLSSPSTDIKADFVAAVKGFDLGGAFTFSQTYKIGDVPNPCLKIDGLGTVGIPLSVREARAIISVSEAVYVRNVNKLWYENGKNGSGIWELPSEKVHFVNPAWDAWIQTETGVAIPKALTESAAVQPSFIFKKLVIHEQSDHTTWQKEPISDHESNRKIGVFVVVLPSHFEGAQLQLHHRGQVKTLDLAHNSELSMSVVAAYTGVEHTLAGVSSGYRLSLVYDIVQPVTHVEDRPILPAMQGATRKLQHTLRSWKQMDSELAPKLLASLPQHNYYLQNFSAKSLAGSDELLLFFLHSLARELKFRIYLAHVKATVSTHGSGGSHGRDNFVTNGTDEDGFEFVVTEIVDLCGMPLAVDLDLQPEDLLNGSVTDQDPDDEKFWRYDWRTRRTRIYRRTVLLIWPKGSDTDLGVSVGDIYDYAFNALRNSVSVSPRRKEAGRPTSSGSADRWNDPQILLRALKACGVDKNTNIVGHEGLVSVYQVYGWDVLKDFFGQAMANDESNARRHALLARLTQIGAEEENTEVSSWCKDQADRVLRSLSKVDAAQIPWLIDLGLSRGGEFLRNVILPQLCTQQLDNTFWISFLRRIKQDKDVIPTPSPDVMNGLILECVTQAVQTLPMGLTETASDFSDTASDFSDTLQGSDAIFEVIKLCIETKNEPLCAEIFTKMREATRPCPWLYYEDLSPSLIKYTQDKPALDAVFRPFFIDVLDSMIFAVQRTPNESITRCRLNERHQSIIMKAARKAGGIPVLKERMTAATLKGHNSSTIQALVHNVVREFPRQQLQDGLPQQAYNDLIIALVRLAIDTFDTFSLTKSSIYRRTKPADKMIGMIKFCFKVGAEKQCKRLLRFVPPLDGSTVAQHVSKILAPFISVLRRYLLSKGLDFQTEPYKMFSAAVVEAFAEQVIGQKPTEVVPAALREAVGCQNCEGCHKLKAFFLSDAPTIELSRAQPIRTHLEGELQKTSSWGVTWQTVRSGNPYTLLVTKPASMTAVARWRANSQTGKMLLQQLGDAATQARILGAAYPMVYAQIHGEEAPPVDPGLAPIANASHVPKRRVATNAPPANPVSKKPRIS
ncbi:hypothetical protein MSAN_02114500 [Mycena sanguinolenta]|uniref:Uncharacterized protein n=1 Tax=Mycena sanguinolenta TaxID=230812 RepID=A0A8H6XIA1_9AGAR|nr:hypothetical protein MSAN_02114500 [Mycena sanguinolenta]